QRHDRKRHQDKIEKDILYKDMVEKDIVVVDDKDRDHDKLQEDLQKVITIPYINQQLRHRIFCLEAIAGKLNVMGERSNRNA
ncbi:hypothetical protein, partial [Clostridium perfringens]